MFEAVQHVVLVDNQSDDGTLDVARQVAASVGAADRLTLATYPFRVSRAGTEHLTTPPHSVHSLTHFYNWSFAHVRTTYSMKWDGDMVLTPEGVAYLADLSWQLEDSGAVVAIPRHPLSIVSESEAWLDLGYKFLEPWVYPMGPEFTFVKAFEWEVREFPDSSERIVAPEGLCVELKWLDADEFAHWSSAGDFDRARAPRKAREWDVTPRSPPAAARRCPGWCASRRRPACTSSTTSRTRGCRRPSARSCSGCRPGRPSMSEPYPEPVRAFLDQRGEQLVLSSASGPGAVGQVPAGARRGRRPGRAARPVLPHAVRTPTVAVWISSLDAAPGLGRRGRSGRP